MALQAAVCPVCPFNTAQPPSAPAGSVHQGVPEQPGLRLRMAVIMASVKTRQILRASSSEVSSSRKEHAWHLCSTEHARNGLTNEHLELKGLRVELSTAWHLAKEPRPRAHYILLDSNWNTI